MPNPNMQGIAALIAQQGRNGDTMLMHVAPEEVNALARMGAISENPITKLPEAFKLKDLVPFIGNAFLGPAFKAVGFSPGVSSFLATTASTMLGGGSLEKGIMSGLVSSSLGRLGQNLADTAPGATPAPKDTGYRFGIFKRPETGTFGQRYSEAFSSPQFNPIEMARVATEGGLENFLTEVQKPGVMIPFAVGAGELGRIKAEEDYIRNFANFQEAQKRRRAELQRKYPQILPGPRQFYPPPPTGAKEGGAVQRKFNGEEFALDGVNFDDFQRFANPGLIDAINAEIEGRDIIMPADSAPISEPDIVTIQPTMEEEMLRMEQERFAEIERQVQLQREYEAARAREAQAAYDREQARIEGERRAAAEASAREAAAREEQARIAREYEVARQEAARQEAVRQAEIQRQQEMARQEAVRQEEIRRAEEERARIPVQQPQEIISPILEEPARIMPMPESIPVMEEEPARAMPMPEEFPVQEFFGAPYIPEIPVAPITPETPVYIPNMEDILATPLESSPGPGLAGDEPVYTPSVEDVPVAPIESLPGPGLGGDERAFLPRGENVPVAPLEIAVAPPPPPAAAQYDEKGNLVASPDSTMAGGTSDFIKRMQAFGAAPSLIQNLVTIGTGGKDIAAGDLFKTKKEEAIKSFEEQLKKVEAGGYLTPEVEQSLRANLSYQLEQIAAGESAYLNSLPQRQVLSDLLKNNQFSEAVKYAQDNGMQTLLTQPNELSNLRQPFTKDEARQFMRSLTPEFFKSAYGDQYEYDKAWKFDPEGAEERGAIAWVTGAGTPEMKLSETGYPMLDRVLKPQEVKKDAGIFEKIFKAAAIAAAVFGGAQVLSTLGGAGGSAAVGGGAAGAGAGLTTFTPSAAAAQMAASGITGGLGTAALAAPAVTTGIGSLTGGTTAAGAASGAASTIPTFTVTTFAPSLAASQMAAAGFGAAGLASLASQPAAGAAAAAQPPPQPPPEPPVEPPVEPPLPQVTVTTSPVTATTPIAPAVGIAAGTVATTPPPSVPTQPPPQPPPEPPAEPLPQITVTGTKLAPIDIFTPIVSLSSMFPQTPWGTPEPIREPTQLEKDLDQIEDALRKGEPIPGTSSLLDKAKDVLTDYGKSQLTSAALSALMGGAAVGAGGYGGTAGYRGTGGLGYLPEGQERRYIDVPEDYMHGFMPEFSFFENLNPPALIDTGTPGPENPPARDFNPKFPDQIEDQRASGGMLPRRKVYSERGYLDLLQGYQEGGMTEKEDEYEDLRGPITDGNKRLIDLTKQVILGEVTNRADEIIQKFIDMYGIDAFQDMREDLLEQSMPNSTKEGMVPGNTGGMDDMVDGVIGNQERVAVSPGEYIIPADVVSALGDGNSKKGEKELDALLSRVRKSKYGSTKQPPPINIGKVMPV